MNEKLFASGPKPDAVNHEGAPAFAMPPEEALAQIACTGFFADTFYVAAEQQLADILAFAKACPDEFVARCAIYARDAGNMKDATTNPCRRSFPSLENHERETDA